MIGVEIEKLLAVEAKERRDACLKQNRDYVDEDGVSDKYRRWHLESSGDPDPQKSVERVHGQARTRESAKRAAAAVNVSHDSISKARNVALSKQSHCGGLGFGETHANTIRK